MTDHRANTRQLAAQARTIARRAEQWMLNDAFGFWAQRAPDPNGGFYEKLDLQGHGIDGLNSRVRLQARMVFTFALTADLGWDRERSKALALRGIETLTKECRRGDGLYGKIVRTGEGLVDDAAETYDSAFALLAFSTAFKVFALPAAEQAAKDLSAAIERELKHSDGGYRERLPAPPVREQNPHMHLAEASLAWFEASGDQASLDRVQDIVTFLQGQFADEASGQLLEYSGGLSADNRIEVGHLFEWVWILGRLKQLTGEAPEVFAASLHDCAIRLIDGLDYLPLSQKCDGSVREARQRTWGATEKLKAHITMWRMQPSDELAALVVETAQAMFADHVDGALPGAWIDEIAPDKTSLITDITPATGYHIFLACKELIDFAAELEPELELTSA